MILDSHCHAWRYWPYEPPVPDPESRGTIEQLLFAMDRSGVDRAMIVCARIDHNPENNEYIGEQVRRFPARLDMVADVDCSWWPTYHTPGAAQRLAETADQLPLVGFTHYLAHEDDGSWLNSPDGVEFMQMAEARNLIASISCGPQHFAALRQAAAAFPSVPILLHHMGMVKAAERWPHPHLQELLQCAALPNMFVKVSGFAYAATVKWDFPYSETLWIVRALYEHFGPHRLCWGSDYPVVRQFMTYRHALEALRTHCTFIPADDMAWILGKSLARLIDVRKPA
jgi:predicted TIM-barrel fold metal-dependent hydrolase